MIAKAEASREALRDLVGRFFDNSFELLVLNVLQHERISNKELKRLKKLIE